MTFSSLLSPFLPDRTIDTHLLRRRKGTKSTYRTWPCAKTGSGNWNDRPVFFFLAAAKGILSLPTVTEQNDRARHHSVPAMLHNSKRKTSRLAVRRRSTRWNLIATNVQVRVFLKFRSFWSPRLEERIAYINTQTPIYPFEYCRLEKTLTPSSKSKSWIHFCGTLCAGKARLPRASLDKRRTRDGENRAYIQVPWEFYTGIGISALWSNPLILFYTIFGRKGSLFFTFYWQKVTLSNKKV